MQWFFKKLIGSKNARDIKRMKPLINQINTLEKKYQSLREDQLRAKTDELKQRFVDGETLDDLLCEAFATVKKCLSTALRYGGRCQ